MQLHPLEKAFRHADWESFPITSTRAGHEVSQPLHKVAPSTLRSLTREKGLATSDRQSLERILSKVKWLGRHAENGRLYLELRKPFDPRDVQTYLNEHEKNFVLAGIPAPSAKSLHDLGVNLSTNINAGTHDFFVMRSMNPRGEDSAGVVEMIPESYLRGKTGAARLTSTEFEKLEAHFATQYGLTPPPGGGSSLSRSLCRCPSR